MEVRTIRREHASLVVAVPSSVARSLQVRPGSLVGWELGVVSGAATLRSLGVVVGERRGRAKRQTK